MEKESIEFSAERSYCNSFDGLVSTLTNRMEVDERKLLVNKKDNFDSEDINSWIRAVKFKNGIVPDIQANLSVDKGSKTFNFVTKNLETVKSEDEEMSPEQMLYSMAMTEAKMKAVQGMAEEVYPAVGFQIGDYRKEMEKVRKEIFEVRDAKVVLKETMRKLSANGTLKLATALVITSMILSACGTPQKTETPVINTQPVVTETSPASETPVAETPFVEATQGVENEQTTEIMKQVDMFLNEEYPYTEDWINNQMFREPSWNGEVDLGILHTSTEDYWAVDLQGSLLGTVESSDGIVLILGVQDEDGERYVTPVKIYDELYLPELVGFKGAGFPFWRMDKKMKPNPEYNSFSQNKNDLLKIFNDRVEKILGVMTVMNVPALTDDTINQMAEVGYANPEESYIKKAEALKEIMPLNKNLVLNLWYPLPETQGSTYTQDNLDKYGTSDGEPEKIDSIDDILKLDEPGYNYPSIIVAFGE